MRAVQVFMLVAALTMSFQVCAQGRGGRGGRGRGGFSFTPEKMAEWMNKRQKENLKLTDDEWTVIEPLLKEVTKLQMNERFRGRSVSMRGHRPQPKAEDGEEAKEDPMAKVPGYAEAKALNELIKKDGATADEIKKALEAYRKVCKEQDELLKKAKEALRQVLTAKQEAQLVLAGTLD